MKEISGKLRRGEKTVVGREEQLRVNSGQVSGPLHISKISSKCHTHIDEEVERMRSRLVEPANEVYEAATKSEGRVLKIRAIPSAVDGPSTRNRQILFNSSLDHFHLENRVCAIIYVTNTRKKESKYLHITIIDSRIRKDFSSKPLNPTHSFFFPNTTHLSFSCDFFTDINWFLW